MSVVLGAKKASDELTPRSGPPSVLRGANKVVAGLDWLRLAVPREHLEEVDALLTAELGPGSVGAGRFFRKRGIHYGAACLLFSDPDHDGEVTAAERRMIVELPGSVCAGIPLPRLLNFARTLLDEFGAETLRADLRLDLFGEGLDLIERMLASCEAGELCRYKVWNRHDGRRGGEIDNLGVSFGARGSNGGGVYFRVYDKGLERGVYGVGQWVRLEVELKDERAGEALGAVLRAQDPIAEIGALVVGHVEFREVRAGETAHSRRPMVRWWFEFVDWICCGRGVVTAARRALPTLAGQVAWLRSAVAPILRTAAAVTGRSVGEVLDVFAGTGGAEERVLHKQAGREMLRLLGVPFAEAERRVRAAAAERGEFAFARLAVPL